MGEKLNRGNYSQLPTRLKRGKGEIPKKSSGQTREILLHIEQQSMVSTATKEENK